MVHYLYVIGKGEFEITIKTLVSKEKEEASTSELVGFLRP